MKEETPKELQLDQMIHDFHPLIMGFYPTLNPTELITFHSENGALNNLTQLLGNFVFFCKIKNYLILFVEYFLVKVQETGDEIEKVINEGMALRRHVIGM